MYQVGDKVVHPVHGAGVIDAIVQQKHDGVVREYYRLSIAGSTLVIMIPLENISESGLRAVVSQEVADAILADMAELQVSGAKRWNQRYRENMVRLKSGDLREVARVVKALRLRERQRSLSTVERKMLHTAKHRLIAELVFAKQLPRDVVEQQVEQALRRCGDARPFT